jgi:hypothetical protein
MPKMRAAAMRVAAAMVGSIVVSRVVKVVVGCCQGLPQKRV